MIWFLAINCPVFILYEAKIVELYLTNCKKTPEFVKFILTKLRKLYWHGAWRRFEKMGNEKSNTKRISK